ncbi:MAG: tRNA uridine-5-carboxymethylaminomethyl(34) synthesis GTPase MnmE [Sphingobacteriales bacterium]|nr:MAG: tRNA uridine-5-carboxymethylaminomethyl(34) synthesis GTPase MnmE [Sphingobacteriales bacterium]TAF79069.1 MAG: tRNA uridine-5-carboxymethylaminomethyl(34) synthesis GTPase MnmE [Sphingobacteriales bacterium]
MQNHIHPTIVALATATGVGAIAVIRLSGIDAIHIANKIFTSKNLENLPSHTLHFGTIKDGDLLIDEVLLALFIAPQSYTKENVVEISCHGSPYIIESIIKLCIKNGAQAAKPGEFTLRAFLNGSLDLSQAEAVADLIASGSKSSHQLALQQMRGGFSSELKNLREQLVYFASMIELELDFGEEDVEFANRAQLKTLILNISKVISRLIQSFEMGNVIKNGVPVAIVGKPNVGKSTLLNALLNEERAIVSEIAGTTRDTIEDEITLGGIRFRFIDTAGIRQTTDVIEAKGVERTFEKIKQASIVLYLLDPRETSEAELTQIVNDLQNSNSNNSKLLLIINKADDENVTTVSHTFTNASNFIYISARELINIAVLEQALIKAANINAINTDEVIVSNIRHLEALQKTETALNNVLYGIDNPITSDFLVTDIKQALYFIGEITGEITTDDLLETIFSKFCIGK